MERMTTRLRGLLARPGVIMAPACFDPLSARIAEAVGFECIALSGFAVGSRLAISEPLMTLMEVVDASSRMAASINIPIVADAGAGFGEPLHTMRTVREFERAGVAGVHIEDQIFPKRAHYHRDYREHTISAEEMAQKIRFACQARRDPDFVIIARTDAMRTHGYDEAIRRTELLAEAGADMVMLFPNNMDEARRAPRDCRVPLVYVNSHGNRVGRPVLSAQELEDMGYKLGYDATGPILASYLATRDVMRRLKATGSAGLAAEVAIEARKDLEDTIGLEEYYKVEEQTVEKGGAGS